MKMPRGVLRSRSFSRFTIRVGLPHLGQSVLLVVSIIFLRSAVLAILAIGSPSFFWCGFILPYAEAFRNPMSSIQFSELTQEHASRRLFFHVHSAPSPPPSSRA